MRHLLFVLVLLSAACGNVTSGVDTRDPNGPGASDDDDDGGGGDDEGNDDDPGTMPSQIGGMATFARFRDNHSDDFTGMVQFFPVPVPMPANFQEFWDDFPQQPFDTCEEKGTAAVALSSNIQPPSAGEITLEGPNGTLTLSSLMEVMYLSVWNPTTLFVPNAEYRLKSTGGQIEAFDHPMTAPGEVLSLDPNPLSTDPFPLSRTQPLPVRWESVPDGRPLYLYFRQQHAADATPLLWMCKLTDDGEFDVPVEVLQAFDSTVTPWVGEAWRDKVELRRSRLGSFFPQGSVGPVLTSFESGWFANVQFQ